MPPRASGKPKRGTVQVKLPVGTIKEIKRLARREGLDVSTLCGNILVPIVLDRLAARDVGAR